ncbi:hypothetical protein BCR35DRAFT_305063 [Leucosporidium creatinivorum]|uniref:Uncharacterized protein n=1 Tax=Leucosporidium creatinivorum TaxID=106004 RepID=A0A1Y2F3E5_9BASI|nr:hypothetical protein BCR35DRAFT_305063 [Leucosporidium creatinivorum]
MTLSSSPTIHALSHSSLHRPTWPPPNSPPPSLLRLPPRRVSPSRYSPKSSTKLLSIVMSSITPLFDNFASHRRASSPSLDRRFTATSRSPSTTMRTLIPQAQRFPSTHLKQNVFVSPPTEKRSKRPWLELLISRRWLDASPSIGWPTDKAQSTCRGMWSNPSFSSAPTSLPSRWSTLTTRNRKPSSWGCYRGKPTWLSLTSATCHMYLFS